MELLMLLITAPFFLLTTCSPKPAIELAVVPGVDLNRYLGKWYEIATIPQRFQLGCHCVTAEYSLRHDGKVKVVNSCHKDSPTGPFKSVTGQAKVVKGSNNAKLKVSFFWPFWGNYWIINLDQENYQWAIVTAPSRKTLWILSRTPEMDEDLYEKLVEFCKSAGLNTDLLLKTDQSCHL
jgi:apolipoprotein D and lipocalin family protein